MPHPSRLARAVLAALAAVCAGQTQAAVELVRRGTYPSGIVAGAEIVAYDAPTRRLFVTNGALDKIDVLDVADVDAPQLLFQIDIAPYGGSLTSVAVKNGVLAAAIPNADGTQPGVIALFDADGMHLGTFTAGVLPDHVSFSPDGRYVLSANEGEPVGDVDPPGSVTVVDLAGGAGAAVATTIGFDAFDGREEELRARGVRLFPGRAAGVDLEPEYIATAPGSDVAFVSLQEANAFAVIDLASLSVEDIVAAGLKDHSRGLPRVDTYTFPQLPTLGTTPAGQTIRLGGFSGLWFEGTDASGALKFITVPDRGPNGEPSNVDGDAALERPFVLPDYQPRIVRFSLDPASGAITLGAQLPLFRQDGTTPMTGLPNIGNGVDEEPVDLFGKPLPLDPLGADIEGLVVAADGSYWMVDEYRPAIYHFSSAGVLVDRFVPQGTGALGGQPAGHYGQETLPAEYSTRRPNRGFEGMAYDTDAGVLYAFIQTPLANPDTAASNASKVIRMLGIDPASGATVAEYVYLIDKTDFREQNTDKIGDAAYLGNGRFALVERDDSTERSGKKMLFEFTLKGATNLRAAGAPAPLAGLTLEQHTPDQLAAAGIRAVSKRKVANLPSLGYFAGDKLEGLAALPDGRLALINDNDFGIAPQPLPSPPDGSVPMDAEPTPIQLGLVSFDQPSGLDASDRDGPSGDPAIDIRNWPVFGMHMPDSIAAFSAGGATFYASAGEGDDRGEVARISSLELDPGVFPDAAALQTDAQIGRLNASTIDGDLDGDGKYDRLQILGSRSMAVWDRWGNLVYDSGDLIEQVTAARLPTAFNSDNEANDSFDTRSDNKGPEPEALAVGTTASGRTYAFVGLERVGGIVAFDVTDPYAVSYAGYVNPRDFGVELDLDVDPATAGDLGPEGIVFIPAADSPTGEAMIAVANEISGTTTLYTVSEVLFRDGFDGEAMR
ncbi:choice-of-anchor I domain-containing protein [Dokdonella ginsengisoli]|uniref:Esterase-like activity of phytase family protein n=1 Tax=Dokdonella ginsengisoli TaxID=363846 RepID=A0ABV9QVY6_9GAMM